MTRHLLPFHQYSTIMTSFRANRRPRSVSRRTPRRVLPLHGLRASRHDPHHFIVQIEALHKRLPDDTELRGVPLHTPHTLREYSTEVQGACVRLDVRQP